MCVREKEREREREREREASAVLICELVCILYFLAPSIERN